MNPVECYIHHLSSPVPSHKQRHRHHSSSPATFHLLRMLRQSMGVAAKWEQHNYVFGPSPSSYDSARSARCGRESQQDGSEQVFTSSSVDPSSMTRCIDLDRPADRASVAWRTQCQTRQETVSKCSGLWTQKLAASAKDRWRFVEIETHGGRQSGTCVQMRATARSIAVVGAR